MTDIVEQAARVLCEANGGNPDYTPKSYVNGIATGEVNDPLWVDYIDEAQALADAGLLAEPARTVPHRDEIAAAIAAGYEPDDPTPNRHDYRAADAVLELMVDQPTVAEVEARALERFAAGMFTELSEAPGRYAPLDKEFILGVQLTARQAQDHAREIREGK